ncbi:MAG: hypothetical protein SGBAC_006375 [Bacillariaceae sp.]
MSFLRDSENARKNGVVGIMYTIGKFKNFDMGASLMTSSNLAASLPIPLSGIHFCHDDLAQHIMVNSILPLLPLSMAPKFKAHYGSGQECLYAMRRFGISEDSIPISNSGNTCILDDHKRWYQEQKEKDARVSIEKEALTPFGMITTEEASSDNCVEDPRAVESEFGMLDTEEFLSDYAGKGEEPKIVESETIVPKSEDVLFGHFSQHPGNIRLHKLLADHAVAYELAKGKKEKMEYAWKLVLDLKEQGSRFLSFDKASKSWLEVPDAKARLKVSKAIRNRRR